MMGTELILDSSRRAAFAIRVVAVSYIVTVFVGTLLAVNPDAVGPKPTKAKPNVILITK